jgi:peptidoglycan/LPS O-acetylase OafA/YrhL
MKNRGQLAVGLVLILLGLLFFAQRQIPAVSQWMDMYMQWPLNIVAAGVLILIFGLLIGVPAMAIPAAVVAGIGGILYYQVRTEDMQSWSYMWALIPGFVGVGSILAGLLSRNMQEVRSGANAIAASAVLFIVFAAFFGKLALLGNYGPAILLVLLGVWILVQGLWRNRRSNP